MKPTFFQFGSKMLKLVSILSLGMSMIASAQPMSGFCEKKFTVPKIDIKQKKAPAFFKIKTGTFCTTPVTSSNGNLITGCDDSLIRIISNTGVLLKSLKIEHNPDAGIASNPEIVAIPNTIPEQYVATSMVDRILIRFDSTGKVLAKIKYEADLGKPIIVNDSSYFVADGDGVGHLFVNNQEAVLYETKSNYLNDPVVRTTLQGETQIVISDTMGSLFVLNPNGEVKTIKLTKEMLLNATVSPDGKIWVSDYNGIMYVVDLDTKEVKTIKTVAQVGFANPVFLKNGKVAFGSGDYVYIFNQDRLDQPAAIFDTTFNNKDFLNDKVNFMLGSLIKNSDFTTVTVDGSEYIWIPTYGGYHLINDSGVLVGYFSYGAGNGDAETYSAPVQLKDGSFAIGMYYGIDRVSIRKNSSGAQLTSKAWAVCE